MEQRGLALSNIVGGSISWCKFCEETLAITIKLLNVFVLMVQFSGIHALNMIQVNPK